MLEYTNDPLRVPADATALTGFFDGWPSPPSVATHARLLRASDLVELAFDGDDLVGFATAITDGVLAAFVPLLEVRASHRGRGIGGELVRRLLARLDHFYSVDLACDDGLVAFYERFGLRRLTAVGRRTPANVPRPVAPKSVRVVDGDASAGQVCADLLAQLPTWFGIPEANADYVAAAEANETLVAMRDVVAVGLLTLVHHSPFAAEVHLMAVRPDLHRSGVGRALLAEAEDRLRVRGVRFLQVKTLDATHPDPGYAKTRAFYLAMGFVPLEVFPDLWDPSNPALQMIKAL